MKGRTQALRVSGMDCAEEVALLRRELGALVGGADRLGFDLVAGKLSFPSEIDAEAVRRRIDATGMKALPWRAGGGARA
ncbi:MAG: heavy-metal-associated domain-containing protein, partial [Thermoanaerobaculia bacterium]